jgi:hypothetical protein
MSCSRKSITILPTYTFHGHALLCFNVLNEVIANWKFAHQILGIKSKVSGHHKNIYLVQIACWSNAIVRPFLCSLCISTWTGDHLLLASWSYFTHEPSCQLYLSYLLANWLELMTNAQVLCIKYVRCVRCFQKCMILSFLKSLSNLLNKCYPCGKVWIFFLILFCGVLSIKYSIFENYSRY